MSLGHVDRHFLSGAFWHILILYFEMGVWIKIFPKIFIFDIKNIYIIAVHLVVRLQPCSIIHVPSRMSLNGVFWSMHCILLQFLNFLNYTLFIYKCIYKC